MVLVVGHIRKADKHLPEGAVGERRVEVWVQAEPQATIGWARHPGASVLGRWKDWLKNDFEAKMSKQKRIKLNNWIKLKIDMFLIVFTCLGEKRHRTSCPPKKESGGFSFRF